MPPPSHDTARSLFSSVVRSGGLSPLKRGLISQSHILIGHAVVRGGSKIHSPVVDGVQFPATWRGSFFFKCGPVEPLLGLTSFRFPLPY